MAVKKPAELDFSNKKFMAIISGQPGLGKTTLALSAPEPFLFDADNGVSRVRAEHRCPTSTVSDYGELLEDLKSPEYQEAQTAVIDTGGTLVQLLKPWAKKQDPKAARDARAMFGVMKQEFDRLCWQIRTQDKKHLVVVFHTSEQVKGDTIQTRLSCEGSAKDIVWTPADFGGHMFVSGGQRVIGFSPTDEYFAKGCFGISGVIPVPELQPGVKNDFLTRLFQAAQETISEESKLFQAQREAFQLAMAQGTEAVSLVRDPDTAKAALERISGLSHALTSKTELRNLLNQKLKETGLRYCKDSGGFEPIRQEGAETCAIG